MKLYCKIIMLVCLFTMTAMAQSSLDYSSMLPLLNSRNTKNENKKEIVQAMFIQTMFVDQLMKDQSNVMIDEDEDDFFSSKTDHFFNSMLSYEISKMLAKQDILGFNDLDLD